MNKKLSYDLTKKLQEQFILTNEKKNFNYISINNRSNTVSL